MNEHSWDRSGINEGGQRGRGYQNFDRDQQWEADRQTHSYGRGRQDEGERSGSSLRDTGYEHMSPGSSRSSGQYGRSWDDGRYQSAPARGGNREGRGEYGDGEEFGGRYGYGQSGAGQGGSGQGGAGRYDSRGAAWSSRQGANSPRFEDNLREPSGRGYGRGRPDMGTYGGFGQGQGAYLGSSMGSGQGSSGYGGSSYGGRYEGKRSDSVWGSVGGGMNHSGRGPKGYRRSDDRIEEEVNERLKSDYELDASDIEASVKDCVVTLSGTVSDRRSKRVAEDCCEDISGVEDVTNQIRVKAHDDELTTQKPSGSSKSGTQQSSSQQASSQQASSQGASSQQGSSRNTSASGQTVSPSRS